MAELESTLAPGLERSDEFTVAPPLVTDVGGTIGSGVLSTPGMIGMMEASAQVLAYEHLPEGKATVGFEVCVKHVAAAAEGATCRTAPRCARSSKGASCASTSRSAKASARSASAPTSGAWSARPGRLPRSLGSR